MSNIDSEKLLKGTNIQKIADDGVRIYAKIKVRYEPQEHGKFLAIDIDSESAYLGNSSAEALEKAKQKHPQKVFYVVKIGFDTAETNRILSVGSFGVFTCDQLLESVEHGGQFGEKLAEIDMEWLRSFKADSLA